MELDIPWIVGPKIEGAPMHPEELTWEHGEECEACRIKYQRQLAAWKEYNKCGS